MLRRPNVVAILFVVSGIFFLATPPVGGQVLSANQLCLQNGGESFVPNYGHGRPDSSGGKYFPSFTHWAALPGGAAGTTYPWKIAGWGWHAMLYDTFTPVWHFETCLQKSRDNPHALTMSFDYPRLFCTGDARVSGAPMPMYAGTLPGKIPLVGGNEMLFPSSMGGFDAYLNLFALAAPSYTIPSTWPFYGWRFAVSWDCASAISVPSACSIWEYTWKTTPNVSQYLVLSSDEVDCLGSPGNKGRSYSMLMDASMGNGWYFPNNGQGTGAELDMALFVCDAITIPVNRPGTGAMTNPFASYGFDVGVTTLTPLASSGAAHLGFMTEDAVGLGGDRAVLGALAISPTAGPYGSQGNRMPLGWDLVTRFLAAFSPLFFHRPAPAYPASLFGTTFGAHTPALLIPPDPVLTCLEMRFASYPVSGGAPMSASFMTTFF